MTDKGINLLADYVFLSKYSQRKEDGTLETWEETVDRIYAMHEVKLKTMSLWNNSIAETLEKAKRMEKNKIILSSQRGRQFASPDPTSGILKHETKLYNCCSTYIDRIEVFSEIMYLLLCGCGVGYSLHKPFIENLPEVKPPTGAQRPQFFVEDSIEGWADSIKELITGLYEGTVTDIVFDAIRPEGALIDGKFMAPGPEPLIRAHKLIKSIFASAVGRKLKTIELHDVICHIADSVVSGGVRRSAMIALFDKDDNSMLTAKTGNWWVENPQRAMANNSILSTFNDPIGYSETKEALNVIRQFGEPGFVNVPNYWYVVNPCAEIVMKPISDATPSHLPESGFAFCNLVEINAERVGETSDFFEACEVASFVATVQALYTNFKYLSRASREIAERDRAVGVSITGILANPILREEVLLEGARLVAKTNQAIAALFGINHSRTCTTIKPSGNASSILGLYCSGIHPAHDSKYLRRVRIKTYSPEYQALKDSPMVKVLRGDEAVISFPIEVDRPLVFKNDITAVEHLKFIGMVKHYWINKGSITKRAIPNNVSATVEVEQEDWDEVAAVLYTNSHLYTGISLLPKHGDQIYDNAPFQRLSSPEVEAEFNAIKDFLDNNVINFNEIMSKRDLFFSGDMVAVGCSGGACELK